MTDTNTTMTQDEGKEVVRVLLTAVWNRYTDALINVGKIVEDDGTFEAFDPAVEEIEKATWVVHEFIARGPNPEEVMQALHDELLKPSLKSFMRQSYDQAVIDEFRTKGVEIAMRVIQEGMDKIKEQLAGN